MRSASSESLTDSAPSSAPLLPEMAPSSARNKQSHVKKYSSCSVPSCKKNSRSHPELHFPKFPRDEHRCRMWVKAVGDPDLVHVPVEKLCTLRQVCSEHFEPRDFSVPASLKGKVRLSSTGVPSIFNPHVEPLSDEVMKEFVGYANERPLKRSCSLLHFSPSPAKETDHNGMPVSVSDSDLRRAAQADCSSSSSSLKAEKVKIKPGSPYSLEVYPMRFLPGRELTSGLKTFLTDNQLKAAFILTCVGSVSSVDLRFATKKNGDHKVTAFRENLEICSLTGTVCVDGFHLHGTFGDSEGKTCSGHVIGNMVVQTTAEVVLGEALGAEFHRKFDNTTGFRELVIL